MGLCVIFAMISAYLHTKKNTTTVKKYDEHCTRYYESAELLGKRIQIDLNKAIVSHDTDLGPKECYYYVLPYFQRGMKNARGENESSIPAVGNGL